jgi:predicted RNA binding protein YcfA (HicA-like mRNA interferase family)
VPELAHLSGREAVRALQQAGWQIARQRGSHVVLTKAGSICTLSVPLHSSLGPGLLRDLIRKAGLSVQEFNDLAAKR